MHTIALVFSFVAFAGLAVGQGSQTPREVKFKDTDGDWIRLVIENRQINQYVNNKLTIRGMAFFKVDQKARTYTDSEGIGKFNPAEDLPKLADSVNVLFQTEKSQKRSTGKQSQAPGGRKAEEAKAVYMKYQGRVCDGRNELFKGKSRSLEDCKNKCARDNACKSFEFWPRGHPNEGLNFCQLSSTCVARLMVKSKDGGDLYVKQAQASATPLHSTPSADDFYERLGVAQDADQGAIKKAFREAAKHWHPDKNVEDKDGAEKMFKNLAEAHDVLSDPEKRAEYDRKAKEREGIPTTDFNQRECDGSSCSAYDSFFGHEDILQTSFASRGHRFGGGAYGGSAYGGGAYGGDAYRSPFGGAYRSPFGWSW